MSALWLVLLLVALLLIGTPIVFSLAVASMVGVVVFMDGLYGLNSVPTDAFYSLNDFVLVAVPLFVLMAQVLLAGGVGRDLFRLGEVWLGHLPGGLAIAAIVACAIFAAVSGSSVATALTIGSVAMPEMVSRGYPKRPVLGAIAVGGTLGILIPPSIPMIIYGSVAQQSVGALFSAGMVPGLLMTVLLAGYSAFAFGRAVPRQPASTWTERFQATLEAGWGLSLPVIVVAGIYLGIFTPTEASAVGVVGALVVTGLIYRRLSWRALVNCLRATAKDSAMILLIIVGALMFGHVLTALRVPQGLTEWVVSIEMSRWFVLLVVILFLTVLGMFLEVISILLITVPVLFPVMLALDFDPIWFGIVFVIVMELALLTPPLGLNLFVVQGISGGERVSGIIVGMIPFVLVMMLVLVLVIAFPQLATFLPSLRN